MVRGSISCARGRALHVRPRRAPLHWNRHLKSTGDAELDVAAATGEVVEGDLPAVEEVGEVDEELGAQRWFFGQVEIHERLRREAGAGGADQQRVVAEEAALVTQAQAHLVAAV